MQIFQRFEIFVTFFSLKWLVFYLQGPKHIVLAHFTKLGRPRKFGIFDQNHGLTSRGFFLHEHARPLTCQRARDQ